MHLFDFNRIHKLYNNISSLINSKKIIGLLTVLYFTFPVHLCAQDGEYTVYYYDNGNVSSEGYMVDGKPDGYWKTYYPNGQIKSEGNRENFQLDSTWIFYNEEGEKVSEITYNEGIKEGELRTYKNEVLYEIALFENDKRAGFSTLFYPTGEEWKRIPYVAGKESGEGFEYARDGRVITLLEYEDGYLKRAEKINRKDDRGKRRGPWIEFHPNGIIAMEGTYMNDLKNGIFKTYDKEGNLLSLEKYRNGELVVDTEEAVILDLRNTYYPDGTVKSSGGYVDGKKEGTHRFYDEEGNVINTIVYHRGERTAEGIVDTKGDFQGDWKLFYDTGELKAEGSYENSKRNGEWIFYHKNGEVEHRGKYVEGLPNGKWTWYFDNGKLRREEFYRRGKEDGASVEYDIEGNVITQGEYIAGYKEGEWFYHVGDHTEKGTYRDGERTGVWVHEYPDGELNYEGEYVAGLPVGKHRWYHPNGQIKKEGKYSSGVRVGTWKTYNQEGIQVLTVKYKNGMEWKINGKRVTQSSELSEEDM
jgi:antitoxin component YwqK of YwqJK toxin-antitoxin module